MILPHAILSLLVLAGPATAPSPAAPLACDLKALNPAERAQHQALTAKLVEAVVAQDELANGYALALDPTRLAVPKLAEWAALEARCCPFLDFGIDLSPRAATLRLRLTGGEHVKDFLTTELGAMAPKPPKPATPRGKP